MLVREALRRRRERTRGDDTWLETAADERLS